VVVRSITWRPGETIKVCFRAGTPKARARVAKYASEWMNYANVVLDFGDKDNPRSCQNDNSEAIKIDFVEKGAAAGYWSQLWHQQPQGRAFDEPRRHRSRRAAVSRRRGATPDDARVRPRARHAA
jgi:hypothetical protein